MTNANDVRRAHRLVIALKGGSILSSHDTDFLRSFLPELPAQKTLEELRREVYDVWAGTNGDEWPDDIHGELETWLHELHEQLKGLEHYAEPFNPVHPEFLETEADYRDAPVGTVAIREGGYPWTRIFGSWVAYSRNGYSHSEMAALRGKARILRWGYGK